MAQLSGLLRDKNIHPSRAVVLVPYAQLMNEARTAWGAHVQSLGQQSAFVPRFETTMNWASSAAVNAANIVASPQDIHMDTAIDVLTASSLLQRAGLAAQQNLLAGRLVEAAWTLARIAAAQPPATRLAWGESKAQELAVGMESDVLVFELAIARVALAWAAASGYPTDVLFNDGLAADTDLLVVINGFQADPLTEALKSHFADRAFSIALKTPDSQGLVVQYAAQDLEDEAHVAAACVLAHLQVGRCPVALIAQDRVLTRRVRGMLADKGVALRDETGWKLSTTRAAATLMGLLDALAWDASTDSVLDWLKNAPAFDPAKVALAEAALRKIGCRAWRAVPATEHDIAPIAARVTALRTQLQAARHLTDWLNALRSVLQASAQWEPLVGDAAGMAVMAALHLDDSRDSPFPVNPRMSLQDFSSWVNQALEAASFTPTHPPTAQVVILPLSQLLGRPVQAVVLPGCDEVRLAVSPEPAGLFTPAQRALLGLPTRQQLADDLRAAWRYALTAARLDLLWRSSEGGERLMPSGFLQELQLSQSPESMVDPRTARVVAAQPTPPPLPTGQKLPIAKLSASAYEDLRRCPYRFFALRQLRLQEADELESELGKKDFGNWLHWLLRSFHEALKASPTSDFIAQSAMLNIASDDATRALALTPDEFLPFAAIWPRVRDGYLDWLAAHQATGAIYVEGEAWKDMPLGSLTLVGKIDRIDQMPDGSHLVIDYKTEASDKTKSRIKDAGEDTQLAFYAALLHDDTLAAAYVNLGEKEATKTYSQIDIVDLRDDLIGGIMSDMNRISDGAVLPALGEGKACDFCAARGLCRKDFWA